MNPLSEEYSHKIIGGKGKLGLCLFLELQRQFDHKTVDVFHSDFLNNSKSISKSWKQRPSIFYWCAGSAKTSSTKEACEKDLNALKSFLLTSSVMATPFNLVFLSSGGTVYGNSPGEVDETFPVNPGNYYAEMKVACEVLIQEAANQGQLKALVLRLANVYGHTSPMKPSGLVDLAVHSKHVNIFSSLSSTKQYGLNCDYSKNLINIIDCFGEPNFRLEIRNLFPPQYFSVNTIIELVQEFSNRNLEVSLAESEEFLPLQNVLLRNHHTIKSYPEYWSHLVEYLHDHESRTHW